MKNTKMHDKYYAYLANILFSDPEDFIDTQILSFEEYTSLYYKK